METDDEISGEYLDIRSDSSENSRELYRRARDQDKLKFKFLESSSSREPLTHITDSSSGSEISETIRREMGLQDREIALNEALLILAQGDYKSFLAHPYIKHLFSPAKILIESCGKGDKVNNSEKLWELAWKNKLYFEKVSHKIDRAECISCALDRDLSYAFYEIAPSGNRLIGYMGSACYKIRFFLLLTLVETVKDIARFLEREKYEPGSYEFDQFIIEPIQEILDKIISAPKKMSKYRK